jgi:hypothetical protein
MERGYMKLRLLIMAAALACASVGQAMVKPEESVPLPEQAIIDFNFIVTNNADTNILVCLENKRGTPHEEMYPKLLIKQWPSSIWQQGLLEFRQQFTPLKLIMPLSESATIKYKLTFQDRYNTDNKLDAERLWFFPVNEKNQFVHNYFWRFCLSICRGDWFLEPFKIHCNIANIAYVENGTISMDTDREYTADSIPTFCTIQLILINNIIQHYSPYCTKMYLAVHDTQKEAQKRAKQRIANTEEHTKKNAEKLLNFMSINKTNSSVSNPNILACIRKKTECDRLRNTIEYIFPLVKNNAKTANILNSIKIAQDFGLIKK